MNGICYLTPYLFAYSNIHSSIQAVAGRTQHGMLNVMLDIEVNILLWLNERYTTA